MKVLVINCGSSSVKYELFNSEDEESICSGSVERIGAVTAITKHLPPGGKEIKDTAVVENHEAALKIIMDYLMDSDNGIVRSKDDIEAVGHRVVHGGETFKDSVLIDDTVVEAIEQAIDLAPLHNPPNLKGIQAARRQLPEVPHVAVFDTAFHQTLPDKAFLYGIPNRLYRRYRIRKYGFHGTSHYYVSRRYFKMINEHRKGTRLISCHLGNGASITAIKDGHSVDTSMGFTPLSGLIMGTRSGDVDPSILFYLIEKEELSLNNVHALLNKHSGLLGLSGFAADMRDLIKEADDGDRRCRQAIEAFCYRIKQYIGTYFATLNGCDAIIMTAGIGQYSPYIRSKALAELEHLGVVIDTEKNESADPNEETKISHEKSDVDVYVIPTNEELVIAKDAAKIATASLQSPWI